MDGHQQKVAAMKKYQIIIREAGTETVLKRLCVQAYDRDAAELKARGQMRQLGYGQRIRCGVKEVGQ